jgi:hypothetical protein
MEEGKRERERERERVREKVREKERRKEKRKTDSGPWRPQLSPKSSLFVQD